MRAARGSSASRAASQAYVSSASAANRWKALVRTLPGAERAASSSESPAWSSASVVVPGPNGSRIRYQVGNVYAVQNGRGLKAIGRIRLMSISSEHLQEISPIEAAMEGVEPDYMPSPWGLQPAYLPPFRRLWDRIHPKRPERWEDDPLVWALTFKLEGENDARHET